MFMSFWLKYAIVFLKPTENITADSIPQWNESKDVQLFCQRIGISNPSDTLLILSFSTIPASLEVLERTSANMLGICHAMLVAMKVAIKYQNHQN